MTKQSTAALFISPKYIGPWGDHGWRLSDVYELVEGGSTSYLLRNGFCVAADLSPSPTQAIWHPSAQPLFECLVAMMCASIQSERILAILDESHNLVRNPLPGLAPYWEFSEQVLEQLCIELSAQVRLGLVSLDETSMAREAFVALARAHGFEVEVFSATSTHQSE